MRVLFLRIGVLGAVVVLGWIAIAHAQRGSDTSYMSADDGTGAANPLRTSSSSQPLRPYPSTSRPSSDPFGLQSQRSGLAASSAPEIHSSIPDAVDNRVNTSRYGNAREESKTLQTSAEQSPPGPALTSPYERKREPDRAPPRTEPAAKRSSREPAPFMADPFAMPASPTRASAKIRASHQGSVELPPLQQENNRTVEAEQTKSEGVGQPGSKQLEGVQSPQLSIQKIAPREIQVGKPTGFRVVVRNTGNVPAADVEIHDIVPKGTQLLGTNPQSMANDRGEVVWSVGTVPPGEERSVEMQLMPTDEGEIGSVATVMFRADATARAIATRPQLVVETAGPSKVLIGDKMMLTIMVSNPGTGVATGVVLDEQIPAGLQHPAGSELQYEVGNLKPGETRKLELPLLAHRPGAVSNVLRVRGDGNLHAEHQLDFEVIAPQLDVAMEGPKRRYLERQATYQVSVTNPGTASAKQVELVANLPAGLKFVSANNAGYYEEATRTVHWRLEELPANETGTVELVTMPVEPGRQAIRLQGSAQNGLNVSKEQPVVIEGIAAILFQVADTADPIELNGETTYEVRVVNQGSKAASNVQLVVSMPSELQPVAADGPTRHTLEGNRIVFEGMGVLPPKDEKIYRIRAKGIRPGDLRVSFQLTTDDMKTPVTKEESTRVYADE